MVSVKTSWTATSPTPGHVTKASTPLITVRYTGFSSYVTQYSNGCRERGGLSVRQCGCGNQWECTYKRCTLRQWERERSLAFLFIDDIFHVLIFKIRSVNSSAFEHLRKRWLENEKWELRTNASIQLLLLLLLLLSSDRSTIDKSKIRQVENSTAIHNSPQTSKSL